MSEGVEMRGHVMYSSNGNGNWWRTEWKPQCKAKVFLAGVCQGVKGHKDVHWCFNQSGSYCWDDNDKDPRHNGESGSTPPGHKTYKTPESMQKHYYISHKTTKKVTDKAVIAKLEKDKTPERDASINRPVKFELD